MCALIKEDTLCIVNVCSMAATGIGAHLLSKVIPSSPNSNFMVNVDTVYRECVSVPPSIVTFLKSPLNHRRKVQYSILEEVGVEYLISPDSNDAILL